MKFTGTYRSRRRFIAELDDGHFVGPDCLVLDADGRIVVESLGGDPWFLGYILYRYVANREFGTLSKLASQTVHTGDEQYGTVFPLLGPHSRTYFHWVTEFLPRLRALFEWEAETGERAEVLINQNPPPWKVESLACLGIDESRWSEYRGSGRSDRILVAPYSPKRPSVFTPSPQDYYWLRDRLAASAVEPDGGCPDWLFVSRRDATNRRIVNEEEVLSALSPLNVQHVVPTDYSISEQIALFSNADVVIGPHGAGLANILFSDEVCLIECFQNDLIRPYFFHQAMELGHEYNYVIGGRRGRDLTIPIDRLDEVIDRIV